MRPRFQGPSEAPNIRQNFADREPGKALVLCFFDMNGSMKNLFLQRLFRAFPPIRRVPILQGRKGVASAGACAVGTFPRDALPEAVFGEAYLPPRLRWQRPESQLAAARIGTPVRSWLAAPGRPGCIMKMVQKTDDGKLWWRFAVFEPRLMAICRLALRCGH